MEDTAQHGTREVPLQQGKSEKHGDYDKTGTRSLTKESTGAAEDGQQEYQTAGDDPQTQEAAAAVSPNVSSQGDEDSADPGSGLGPRLHHRLKRAEEPTPIMELRQCGHCGNTEPIYRTYKKCKRCYDSSVSEPRYYCGRQCQATDWEQRHKEEHKTWRASQKKTRDVVL